MTEVAVGRRERKKSETKRRIFVAALELFHEKGFEATTVDEITERADVAKGTFFNYFPRKESILQYLSEEWLEQAEEAAAHSELAATDRLIVLFGTAAAAYGENRALARLVVHVSMQQMCCPEPEGATQRLERFFSQVYHEGQARGEFRAEIDAHQAFGVLGAVLLGTLLWWVGPSDDAVDHVASRLTLQEAVRRQLTIVFDGLRQPGEA
jgi:AcrR family transcriptional regulator